MTAQANQKYQSIPYQAQKGKGAMVLDPFVVP